MFHGHVSSCSGFFTDLVLNCFRPALDLCLNNLYFPAAICTVGLKSNVGGGGTEHPLQPVCVRFVCSFRVRCGGNKLDRCLLPLSSLFKVSAVKSKLVQLTLCVKTQTYWTIYGTRIFRKTIWLMLGSESNAHDSRWINVKLVYSDPVTVI